MGVLLCFPAIDRPQLRSHHLLEKISEIDAQVADTSGSFNAELVSVLFCVVILWIIVFG